MSPHSKFGRPRVVTTPYQNFAEALAEMGDNATIARKLGCSKRRVSDYFRGELPRGSVLAQWPHLLRGLLRDVESE